MVLAAVLGSGDTAVADTPSVVITVDAVTVSSYGYFWSLPTLNGTFEATGDVEDEGTASGYLAIASWPPAPVKSYWYLVLQGDDGTLRIRLHIQSGDWVVTSGTGDYAGATGNGTSIYVATGTWFATYYDYTLTGSIDLA